jgi:hypothetical protein
MDDIRLLKLFWGTRVPWRLELGPDSAYAFGPTADNVDSCAAMLRFGQFASSSE